MFVGLQSDHPGHMDLFLVHGQEYKAVRDAVGKAVLEGRLPDVEAALQVGQVPPWSCPRSPRKVPQTGVAAWAVVGPQPPGTHLAQRGEQQLGSRVGRAARAH